jgi:hypothetical protein
LAANKKPGEIRTHDLTKRFSSCAYDISARKNYFETKHSVTRLAGHGVNEVATQVDRNQATPRHWLDGDRETISQRLNHRVALCERDRRTDFEVTTVHKRLYSFEFAKVQNDSAWGERAQCVDANLA